MSRLARGVKRDRDARGYALQAACILRRLPASKTLVMVYSQLAHLHATSDRTGRAVYWGDQALQLAQTLNTPEPMIIALGALGAVESRSQTPPAGLDKLEESLRLAHQIDDPDYVSTSYVALIASVSEYPDLALARRYCDEGIAFTAEREIDIFEGYIKILKAHLMLHAGEWTQAEQIIRDEMAVFSGVSGLFHLVAYRTLALIAARRGSAAAHELLGQLEPFVTAYATDISAVGSIYATWAEVAWLHGDTAQCSAWARQILTLMGRSDHRWLRGQALVWLWRCDEPVEIDGGIAEPFALQIVGDWVGAAHEWERLGFPYEQAMALADGDTDALFQAFAILDRLGARPGMDYVRQRLRERDVDSIPRGARPSTRQNPLGLTQRQMDVLGLLAENLTNGEIAARLHISRRTVDHHVSAILTKLDVATRDDAIAEAQRQQLLAK
jgi:DNA-binding CsgD family transcriptional regulator